MAISYVTTIVPLDLSQRPWDILLKAVRLARAAERANVTLIFGHNDHNKTSDKLFKRIIQKFKTTVIVSGLFYTEGVNSSLLRNKAFSEVKTDYLLLLDVDIWPDFSLIEKYVQKVKNNEKPFYMVPCLYLTKRGSKDLVSSKILPSELKKRFFSFSRKEFLHLASPSSVIIMKKTDYETLNGFNTDFVGHGYEDFDFMMRLAHHHNYLIPAADLLLDKTARAPLFAVGFRRYLGEQCLDLLLEKDIVFHLHHAKPKESKYHAARPSNYQLFTKLHNGKVGSELVEDPTLIGSFSKKCSEKKLNIHDYAIFFDNKPGHIDRFDSFRRRLRFLLNE